MMVKTDDWRTAFREVVERGRERLGDPPTPEELVAWSRGELSESEAERIRELLALYPDLAAALNESEEAPDDEAPVLSRADLDADWELLQQRISPQHVSPHVAAERVAHQPSFPWRWSTVVPALAALVFGALLVQSRFTVRALREQLNQPRENVERVMLLESASRGPDAATPIALQPTTRYVVFTLPVPDDVRAGQLQVGMRNLDLPSRPVVWRGSVTRAGDGTFSIEVPRSFLTERSYAIHLYLEGEAQPLATYTFWLSR